MTRSLVLTGSLFVLACGTAPIARLAEPETIAFVDITVVDGTGGLPLRHQDVVVAGDRIVSIEPTGGMLNARSIDGRGKSLLPGYVDAHAHIGTSGVPMSSGEAGLTTSGNLERWLLSGVTTLFEMSGAAPEMGDLAERLDASAIAGPRLFHTHLVITGKGSHPIPISKDLVPMGSLAGMVIPQVEDDEDIARVLDVADEELVDFVKIAIDRIPKDTPIMDRHLMVRLVQEARKRDHLVFVHAGDVDDALAAAHAGATALAHLPWRGVFTPEKAEELKRTGVVVVTTVAMWENLARAAGGHFRGSEADLKIIPKAMIATVEGSPHVEPELESFGAELVENVDNRTASLAALIAAGVPLLVGTDSSLPTTWPGSGYLNELRALVAAGVPASDLIVAMTSRPARLMAGKNADFGVVQTGKCADLVVVDGDPLADPSALWRISTVVRNGRIVEAVPQAK
ncbi:MAG: amidohydrolase family protein [Deltaproteobacteria bacterium]|nr:amidohydrolase family protein [Deltaproteobacteria bacterium]